MEASVTTADIAEALGVQPATVARWMADGAFPGAKRIAGRWRIPADEAERFIEANTWDDENEYLDEDQDPEDDEE